MKYFTIGPVAMTPEVIKAGGKQSEYFRDSDFALKVVRAQNQLKNIVGATESTKIALISSSGTGVMEASIVNYTRRGEEVCVVNGGSFGQRFVDILNSYQRRVVEYKPGYGKPIDFDCLNETITPKITTIFVNAHETSTGELFDLRALGKFCKDRDILLICDAISTIGCDTYEMTEFNVNVTLFSANKGLALSPGLAIILADEKANSRLECTESYYFDLEKYFSSEQRGQPPFTSSVSILMQLFDRVDEIENNGGISNLIAQVQNKASIFRKGLKNIEIDIFPTNPSNAITGFQLNNGNSDGLYCYLKSNYQMLINKSAWGLGCDIPRISHIGDLSMEDHQDLINAIEKYIKQCS